MRKQGAALLLLVTILAACSLAPGQPSSSPLPTPSPSPSPSPTTSPSPSPAPGAGFYLRAWYTQALPPIETFGWLPMLTIAEGTVIDGNVAIDMIYPGPLVIVPNARWISEAGIATIVDEARRLALLGDVSDFTGGTAAPGSRVGQLEIVVDGVRYHLVGNPDLARPCGGAQCDGVPGTPEAFAAFWAEMTNLDAWIPAELGAAVRYQPERIAVLLTAPNGAQPGLGQRPVTWPLDGTFEELGVDFPGQAGDRCVTLSGDELAVVWPVLLEANQLTVFVDSLNVSRSVVVAVLVPGEESPCPDSPA
jgi:hypothetical protein